MNTNSQSFSDANSSIPRLECDDETFARKAEQGLEEKCENTQTSTDHSSLPEDWLPYFVLTGDIPYVGNDEILAAKINGPIREKYETIKQRYLGAC